MGSQLLGQLQRQASPGLLSSSITAVIVAVEVESMVFKKYNICIFKKIELSIFLLHLINKESNFSFCLKRSMS